MSDNPAVDPTQEDSNYHLALEAVTGEQLGFILCNPTTGEPSALGIGDEPVPQTTLQISQGAASGYSDMVYPNTPITQSDWSGGRGLEDFDKDGSRYSDGNRVDTIRGDCLLGPKDTLSTGISKTLASPTYTSIVHTDNVGYGRFCVQFTPAETITVKRLGVWLRGGSVQIVGSILNDNAGAPGAVLAYTTYINQALDTLTEVIRPLQAGASLTLNAGSPYWIELAPYYGNSGWDAGIYSQAGYKLIYGGATLVGQGFQFRLYSNSKAKNIFFEYKSALYVATMPDDLGAPKLFINGYRGLAKANTNHPEWLDMNISTGMNQWTGCVVKIVGGKGANEETPWRLIKSNDALGKLTVTPVWNIEQDTTTEYVILGDNTWTEITGHGLTQPVTDVLVVDDIIYFAQGSGANMRRARFYNNAGTWTAEYADDGTNKADYLALISDTSGKRQVWKALAQSAMVASSDTKSWGTDLAFTDQNNGKPCGSANSRITGIQPYDNPVCPWILKEDGYGSIRNGVYAEIPNDEMKSVKSETNGRAHLRHDLFLYFSLLDGMERYYDQRLDDKGPNRDLGMPVDRKGPIVQMVGYPGRFYAALDAGESGSSSILCFNGVGWHEMYRGVPGKRIRSLFIQVIPGDTIDRLWFSLDEDVYWIPITISPYTNPNYLYCASGQVITSWFYDNKKDVAKYWDSVTLFAENLAPTHQTIHVEYQTDSELVWHAITADFTQSPSQQIDISSLYNVTGRRLRLRLTLNSDNQTITPRIKAIVINAVERVPSKYGIPITFLLEDGMDNLWGQATPLDAKGRADKIKAWADSRQMAAPLKIHYVHPYWDGRRVFIDLPSVKVAEIDSSQHKVRLIGRMQLTEK